MWSSAQRAPLDRCAVVEQPPCAFRCDEFCLGVSVGGSSSNETWGCGVHSIARDYGDHGDRLACLTCAGGTWLFANKMPWWPSGRRMASASNVEGRPSEVAHHLSERLSCHDVDQRDAAVDRRTIVTYQRGASPDDTKDRTLVAEGQRGLDCVLASMLRGLAMHGRRPTSRFGVQPSRPLGFDGRAMWHACPRRNPTGRASGLDNAATACLGKWGPPSFSRRAKRALSRRQ